MGKQMRIIQYLRMIHHNQEVIMRDLAIINERLTKIEKNSSDLNYFVDKGIGMSLTGIYQAGGRWTSKDTLTEHISNLYNKREPSETYREPFGKGY